ncbi:peptidase S10 serine carboxypeptidase, partial [Hysterangium stoloniferum]
LLERSIKVLLFAETNDFICNWVSNDRCSRALQWFGQARSANGLTFATVYGAGHMVPQNKPVEALALFSRWL